MALKEIYRECLACGKVGSQSKVFSQGCSK